MNRNAFLKVLLVAGSLLLTACQTRLAPRPNPIAESSVRPGINKEYLNPDLKVGIWIERFEREGREIYDHREAILKAARIRRGASVADIGAGTGLFTPLFAGAVGPQGKVYAVDIVPEFLNLIEKRAAAAGLSQVQTVLCTERSVELPPNSIDVAFICDVYHHFEYPQNSLRSIHRALRRDGELVMVEFRRVPGQSSEWILDHVRAGQEVFTAEIEAAGFEQVEEINLLKDNYMLRFRKARR